VTPPGERKQHAPGEIASSVRHLPWQTCSSEIGFVSSTCPTLLYPMQAMYRHVRQNVRPARLQAKSLTPYVNCSFQRRLYLASGNLTVFTSHARRSTPPFLRVPPPSPSLQGIHSAGMPRDRVGVILGTVPGGKAAAVLVSARPDSSI
jgi:hypothetical protein